MVDSTCLSTTKVQIWIGELERRGIAVRRDILREQARSVLSAYGQSGQHY